MAYDAAGADELVFLDITASRGARDDGGRGARTAEAVYMPLTVGGGLARRRICRMLRAGADKCRSTRRPSRPELIRDARNGSAASASCWRSTPNAGRDGGLRSRSSRTAAGGRRAGTRSPGRARAWTWARARSCSPAWTGTGSRDGYDIELTGAMAEAVSVPVIASGGVGRLGPSVATCWAGPTRCSRPRSSTSVSTACRRPSDISGRGGCRSGSRRLRRDGRLAGASVRRERPHPGCGPGRRDRRGSHGRVDERGGPRAHARDPVDPFLVSVAPRAVAEG